MSEIGVVDGDRINFSFARYQKLEPKNRPPLHELIGEHSDCNHIAPFVHKVNDDPNDKKERTYELTERLAGSWEVTNFDGRDALGCKYCPQFWGYLREQARVDKEDSTVPEVGYD